MISFICGFTLNNFFLELYPYKAIICNCKMAAKVYIPEETPKVMLTVPVRSGTVMVCVPGAFSTPFTAMFALPPLICKQTKKEWLH